MGKMVFIYCNSGICVYTCYSILTCVMHVSCKVQHAYINFIGFYNVFVCMLIFQTFSFRQLNAGPMALLIGDRWQCHPNVGQYVKVDIKVISHYQIVTLILIF